MLHDRLLASIETLYDCVGDEYDRPRALKTYSRLADDSGVFLADIKSEPREFLKFDFYNIPADSVHEATTGFDRPEDNTMLHMYPLLPERVPTLRRVFYSDEEWQKSVMYNKASKPWGLHGECVCVLERGDVTGLVSGFLRHPDQNDIDPEVFSMVALMGQHLHRAIMLQSRLDKLEEALIQSSNVLDLIQFGLALYGSDRSLLFVNAAARRMLEGGDGLRLAKNEIIIGDREANDQFEALLDAIYRPNLTLAQRAGGLVVAPRLSCFRPYSLMVVPMESKRAGMETVSAAVFLFDPMSPRATALELFVSSYNLTRSEAELAHCLALGESLEVVALKRGVSRNTVKSQLHSIFAKTDTSRQSELVSLLLRSIAGINLNLA